MSYTEHQKQAFDKKYSTAKAKFTINKNVLLSFAMNFTSEDLALCDIGGGTGANLASIKRITEMRLKHRVKESVVCDVSIEGLRSAKTLGLQTVKSSVTHLPFRDNSFDVVLNVHVLEHVVDDSRAIRETGRVVKRGGLLYVGTPNKVLNLYVPFILDYHVLGRNPLHVRSGYDADELAAEFNKLGFERILLGYHGFWGAFCAHIFGYLLGFVNLLFRHILKLQKIIKRDKIKHIQDKLVVFDEIFGNKNTHGMNFYMYLRKRTI